MKVNWDMIKKSVEVHMRIKGGSKAPTIWCPWGLLPENRKLFRQCVRGAARDMVTSGKVDMEWMAYYDDHVHNIGPNNEPVEEQQIDDERFRWNVIRYHKFLTGRVGPEWTVERDLPFLDDDKVVAFKSTEKDKMRDFNRKVLPYIRQHPDVTRVYYVRMRMISQWRDGKLPRLVG